MRTRLDLAVDAVAGCTLADKPDDPCDIPTPAIVRHWSDTCHGRCKLDQRDTVGRSKNSMEHGRVAGSQRIPEPGRSEERWDGQDCVRSCRYRGWGLHTKK